MNIRNESTLYPVGQSPAEREYSPSDYGRDTASSNIRLKAETNAPLSKPQKPNPSYAYKVHCMEAHTSKACAHKQFPAVITRNRDYKPEIREIEKSISKGSIKKDSIHSNKEPQTHKGLVVGTRSNKASGMNFSYPRNKVELQEIWKGIAKVTYPEDGNQKNDRLKSHFDQPATSVRRDYTNPNKPSKVFGLSSDNKENLHIKTKDRSFTIVDSRVKTEPLKDVTIQCTNQGRQVTNKQISPHRSHFNQKKEESQGHHINFKPQRAESTDHKEQTREISNNIAFCQDNLDFLKAKNLPLTTAKPTIKTEAPKESMNLSMNQGPQGPSKRTSPRKGHFNQHGEESQKINTNSKPQRSASADQKEKTEEQSTDTVSSKYHLDTHKQKSLYQSDYKEPFKAKVSFFNNHMISLYVVWSHSQQKAEAQLSGAKKDCPKVF